MNFSFEQEMPHRHLSCDGWEYREKLALHPVSYDLEAMECWGRVVAGNERRADQESLSYLVQSSRQKVGYQEDQL